MSDKSKKDRLTRFESSIAEIMRQNYPLSDAGEAGQIWLDIIEDLATMFAIGKPRFDSESFYEACLGGEIGVGWTLNS